MIIDRWRNIFFFEGLVSRRKFGLKQDRSNSPSVYNSRCPGGPIVPTEQPGDLQVLNTETAIHCCRAPQP